MSGCEWVHVRILRVLLSRLVSPQIQHKFYKHVKQMEYDHNEHQETNNLIFITKQE